MRECEVAIQDAPVASDSPEDEGARLRLVAELGHTYRQFGDLVARSVPDDAEEASTTAAFEEALAHVTQAITVFALPRGRGPRQSVPVPNSPPAGWRRTSTAPPRRRHARVRCSPRTRGWRGETAEARCAEAENMLKLTGAQAER